jgi:hypothetical protein
MSAYLLHSLIDAVQIICLGDVRLDGSYVLLNNSNGLIQSRLSSRHDEDVGALFDKALCRSQSDTALVPPVMTATFPSSLCPIGLFIRNLLLECVLPPELLKAFSGLHPKHLCLAGQPSVDAPEGGNRQSHIAVMPPSTGRSTPAMKLASSDARNKAVDAISSGRPSRPNGTAAANWARA